jgi:nucleoid-associated protein YgaU
MLRSLIFLIIVVLLSSCAKPPYAELDAAEYMVGKAYALQAVKFAPTEYQAAKAALADARKAIEKTDYSDARDSLEFTLKHARRAAVLAEEGQARAAEEKAQRTLAEEKAQQLALQAAQAEEATAKAKTPPPKLKPVVKPKPKVAPATEYNVGEGETLWTISAQPKVYKEGLLWPLLYQANRDQIKDPRKIFPGQTLSIRRDMTKEEREDARQKARISNIFPIPKDTPPKQ